MEIMKTWKYKDMAKTSKSRKYTQSHEISRKALHHFTASQQHR